MIGAGFNEIVLSGACPSGKKKNTSTKIINVMAASMIKTKCQPHQPTIKLPTVGASNGDAPSINTRNEMTTALFSTGKKSLTMAMAATEATQPPNAWINLMTHNISIVPAVKQPMVAMMYKTSPAYNGRFLPKRSSKGPYKICPRANPKK